MPFPVAVLDTQDSARSLALQVGYYGYSETGELLSLQAKRISVSETADFAILALGLTKTSQQVGSADSVTVRVTHVCSKLQCWKSKPSLPFLSASGNSSHLLERRLARLLIKCVSCKSHRGARMLIHLCPKSFKDRTARMESFSQT